MTAEQYAAIVGRSVGRVQDLCSRGLLPAERIPQAGHPAYRWEIIGNPPWPTRWRKGDSRKRDYTSTVRYGRPAETPQEKRFMRLIETLKPRWRRGDTLDLLTLRQAFTMDMTPKETSNDIFAVSLPMHLDLYGRYLHHTPA